MIDWTNPAIIGLVIGVPSFILGVLGYRRAVKVDKATNTAAMIAAQSGTTAQIIAGLNVLIENLQEDNKTWRENFKELSLKLAEVVKERDQLQKDYDAIVKKHNINKEK